jgi:hypothetical protein
MTVAFAEPRNETARQLAHWFISRFDPMMTSWSFRLKYYFRLRLLFKTPMSTKHRGTGTRVEIPPSEETQPAERKTG